MLDCEALITEVYNRRALWDMSHPHHHHRGVLDKSWSEVSKRMKASVKEVRQKWKYLRDHFRKELRKFPKGRSPSGYEPTWPYYHLLDFLKDQMVPKDSDDNSSIHTNEDTQLEGFSVKVEALEFDCFDEAVSQQEGIRGTKRPLSSTSIANAKQQRLEERESGSKQDEPSGDYLFFMSLLPMMKKFNDLQKMRVRNKFQQTILEELSQMEEYQKSTSRAEGGC